MVKWTFLGTEEQESIFAFAKANKTNKNIPKLVGGSYSCVRRWVMRGRVKFVPSDLGYQSKLLNAAQCLLVRKTRTGKLTARKLLDEYAPFLTVRIVKHFLQNTPDLRWAGSVGIQPLSRNHHGVPKISVTITWNKEHHFGTGQSSSKKISNKSTI